MGNVILAWQTIIRGNNAWLFSGAPDAISAIGTLISNGGLLEPSKVSVYTSINSTIQGAIEGAVYGQLIPSAWSYSNEEISPFILKSGAACGTSNPLPAYMSSSDGDATWYCNQADNMIYYLMAVHGSQAQDCKVTGCGGKPDCTPNKFGQPPGLSKLNGTAYGGIVYADFIIGYVSLSPSSEASTDCSSALAGYNGNGQKNGWASATASSDTASAAAALNQYGILAPGVVKIPVCATDIAWTNWLYNQASEPYYPCQDVTPLKKRRAMQKRD